jgi:hypothetical protein
VIGSAVYTNADHQTVDILCKTNGQSFMTCAILYATLLVFCLRILLRFAPVCIERSEKIHTPMRYSVFYIHEQPSPELEIIKTLLLRLK